MMEQREIGYEVPYHLEFGRKGVWGLRVEGKELDRLDTQVGSVRAYYQKPSSNPSWILIPQIFLKKEKRERFYHKGTFASSNSNRHRYSSCLVRLPDCAMHTFPDLSHTLNITP